ncbi:hypothetical protein GJ629_05400 [Halapricum sp. CBA1109]|nr:hypothetical protein [Halapricum sp. CBA1109]
MPEPGRYRVLPGPDAGTLRFLDRASFDTVVVPTTDQPTPVGDLRPGYLIEADLDWSAVDPVVESLSVVRPTLYAYADAIDPVFEVAEDLWAEATVAGEGMASQVTRNTDNEVNGVCYVFAEDDVGSRFGEFRDGVRPLEPLVDRFNDTDGPAPRSVFVLRPPDEQFVVVVVAREKGGQFASTLRDTYDCPAPDEPLA